MCVSVCVREREGQTDRQTDRETDLVHRVLEGFPTQTPVIAFSTPKDALIHWKGNFTASFCITCVVGHVGCNCLTVLYP